MHSIYIYIYIYIYDISSQRVNTGSTVGISYHIYQEFNVHFGTSLYRTPGTGGGFYNNVQSFLVIYVQRRRVRHTQSTEQCSVLTSVDCILETVWSPLPSSLVVLCYSNSMYSLLQ